MTSYSLFPPHVDCQFFKFKEGQKGYFYDESLNILLVGIIKDYKLNGKVVHDGTDDSKGWYHTSFNVGYKYDNWDLSVMTWLPYNVNSFNGFMSWLMDPNVTERQIEAYFKVKNLENSPIC